MLSILGRGVRLCDGLTRREVLRVGGLGFTGLLWSDWLRARAGAVEQRPAEGRPRTRRPGTARACWFARAARFRRATWRRAAHCSTAASRR